MKTDQDIEALYIELSRAQRAAANAHGVTIVSVMRHIAKDEIK